MDLERIEFDARNRQTDGFTNQFSFTNESNMIQERMGNAITSALYSQQLNMIQEDRNLSESEDSEDDISVR